ncbi:MAG: hypothetical protein P4L27_03225 [Ignavibacteriaceae bacterium]|nr:hypothetical protein [Ignavibacteriaceae bacterium]
MKDFKKIVLMFLVILPFQSFGGGMMQYNFTQRFTFTQGLMEFFRPLFIYSVWDKLAFVFPLFAFGYIVLIFMFIRKVEIVSWDFLFCIVVVIVYAHSGSWGTMSRYRDIMTPLILLTVFNEDSTTGVRI